MRVDWTLFAIKPSSYISSLCYSIFRIEPYSSCEFKCIYCYARWYRYEKPLVNRLVIKLWRRLAKQLSKTEAPPPFFRLSTLAEPFQGSERVYVLSLDAMKTAYEYEIPLVINTKSVLLTRSPWFDLLLSLADKGLVVVQVSISVSDPAIAAIIEPHAPPPRLRLAMVELLKEHDIPVVVRVQPLIPGLERAQLDTVREAIDHGAYGIITESLRETRDGIMALARALGFKPEDYWSRFKWEPYQFTMIEGKEPLYHPSIEWRKKMIMEIRNVTVSRGVDHTICKEGVFIGLDRYGRDCCQAYHMEAVFALRKTLKEYVLEPEYTTKSMLLNEEDYKLYPRLVRKPLQLHHNKLLKVMKDHAKMSKFIIS